MLPGLNMHDAARLCEMGSEIRDLRAADSCALYCSTKLTKGMHSLTYAGTHWQCSVRMCARMLKLNLDIRSIG